ncbi:MAG: hypothetical protein IPO77_11125, partial [Acidobacteria bacterium]|nr:hypothetical protein [Acidobacteriota bacterium]
MRERVADLIGFRLDIRIEERLARSIASVSLIISRRCQESFAAVHFIPQACGIIDHGLRHSPRFAVDE